jgi:hypothetical protein
MRFPASALGRRRLVSGKLGLRLRSRLFWGRSRSSLYRRVARGGRHHAGSAARRSSRSTASRGSRRTASRCGRSTAGRSRSTARLNRSTTATGLTAATATAMVMMVVVMIAAATTATAAAPTTTAAAPATEREQACGRRAWSSDQKRRAGHHGQHESLAKHQRSPHLLKFLRRVNPEEHPLPLEPRIRFRASFKSPRSIRKSRARQLAQIAPNVPSAKCQNAKSVKTLSITAFKITMQTLLSNHKGQKIQLFTPLWNGRQKTKFLLRYDPESVAIDRALRTCS